jgi:hypothetical protein
MGIHKKRYENTTRCIFSEIPERKKNQFISVVFKMYYVVHTNNTAMSHTGSTIYVMDMNNKDEFITTRNADRMFNGTGNTRAIKWILDQRQA